MDARKMQTVVEQRLLSLEIDQRKFKSDDIFDWLNIAQDQYIKNRIDPLRNNNVDAFQQIQREIDDLRLVMVKSSNLAGSDQVSLKYKEYEVPSTYRHTVRVSVNVTVGACTPVLKPTRIVSNHFIDDMKSDVLHGTSKKSPLSVLIGNKIHIYYNDFSLGDAVLTYIKVPTRIGINPDTLVLSDCELAEHTHNDITDLAVEYAYRILNINQTQ